MKKPVWNVESIKNRCRELGIEFLDNSYNCNLKGSYKCGCGNKFERLFSNVNKGQIYCTDCRNKIDEDVKKEFLRQKFYEFKNFVESGDFGCKIISNVNDYKSNKAKLEIQCSCGNIFYPTANNFKRGHTQCKDCGSKSSGEKARISKEEIFKMVESYGQTPIDYKYEKEHRITIKCGVEHHKPYEISYSNFYSGHRCPSCNKSKGEQRIEDFLKENKIYFEGQFKFDDLIGENNQGLRFDFYIKTEKGFFLVEYDGIQHYKAKFGEEEFLRTLKNDKRKNEYCLKNKIKLVRIPYFEFDNIEKILLENIR